MFLDNKRLFTADRVAYVRANAQKYGFGRFLQVDPVGYRDAMNLYAYVAADPVNHSDPSGNQACNGVNNCFEASNYKPDKAGTQTVTQNAALDKLAVEGSSQLESVGNVENGARLDMGGSPLPVDSSLAGDPNPGGPTMTPVPVTTVVSHSVLTSTMHGVGGADAVEHSHPVGSSFPTPGPNDDVAVKAGLPNNVVSNGNVSVVERVNGQFRVRILNNNNLSAADRDRVRSTLRSYQKGAQ